ncbi:MAG: hypothetical protein INR62_04900 [Rhodospirillales bacterium]|nr:hypothetical protein [Acetobacter sp.]
MRFGLPLTAIPAAMLFTGAALAQAPAATPPGTAPASSGVVTPQQGSTGAPGTVNVNPTGNPGDTITNNSSAGGNANQPERAVPQGGGGGGSK